MKVSQLIVRNLKRRPLATGLTVFSVALGVGLFSAIGSVREASEQAFERSAGMCNTILGAKGSPLELTLNSMYHMGFSTGNISYEAYREFRDEPAVQWSAPTLVGDAYRGYRIVGTTDEIFEIEIPGLGKPEFAYGKAWLHGFEELDAFRDEVILHTKEAEGDAGQAATEQESDHGHGHEHDHTLEQLAKEQNLFEAVVGATVARQTGLRVGSYFVPAHDVMTGGDAHEDAPTKVVGVLKPTGTPMDRAIYIPGGAFYAIEGHQAEEGSRFGGTRDPHGVSAVLAYVKKGPYHLQLRYKYNDRLDVQAAWPVMEVRKLFGVVGNIGAALRIIAVLVIVVALIGVLVALSNTMAARRREFAVLRALGARRSTVLTLVVGESAAVSLLGGILGLGLAVVGGMIASGKVHAQTGVTLSPMPGLADFYFLLAVTAVGALAGLVPAWRAYRTEAARALSSNL